MKKSKQDLQKSKQGSKKKNKPESNKKSKRVKKPESSRDSNRAMPAELKYVIEVEIRETDPLVGMRKWLSEYHSKRPGFHVLQQQTDDFIADFEAGEEKARQEREAAAAEDGWTVVASHKGRKKTTDLKTGISVGGVASAAVERKRKKQTNESVLNFYRFQRREARRNEILELQQRFEEDKKKIAALRAARKFRPY
ncbi:hypothetical protein L7F22_033653 [Adiantum nelumboides]|nr:hypothetical protein [Adiantum nelumboides]